MGSDVATWIVYVRKVVCYPAVVLILFEMAKEVLLVHAMQIGSGGVSDEFVVVCEAVLYLGVMRVCNMCLKERRRGGDDVISVVGEGGADGVCDVVGMM